MSDDNVQFMDHIIGQGVSLPVDRTLANTDPSAIKDCMIIGVDQDGELYFASTFASHADALWWLDKARQDLLKIDEEPFKGPRR